MVVTEAICPGPAHPPTVLLRVNFFKVGSWSLTDSFSYNQQGILETTGRERVGRWSSGLEVRDYFENIFTLRRAVGGWAGP